MDPYVFINYASQSRENALELIKMLEQSGVRTVHGSASEDKIRNSSFVIHLSTSASRSSKTYRRNMNLSVRFDKDCIVMHMDSAALLTDTETMLDTLLSVFKYNCRTQAAAEAEKGIVREEPAAERTSHAEEAAEAARAVKDEEKGTSAADHVPTEESVPEEKEASEPVIHEEKEKAESVDETEKSAVAPVSETEKTAEKETQQPEDTETVKESEWRALSERERLYQEGLKYLAGGDGEPDPVKAFECFKQSANQGYTKAQYQLCVCYDAGLGVRKNIAEAARWCEMAAYGGYDKAQSEIGYCYEYGHGVLRNTKEAVRWYRMAAEQGNIEAKNNLAFCYQKGRGINKNVSEAIRLYKEASDAGHASAQYNLGYCYWYGEGVAVDKNKAVELFRESARRGNARAEQMMRILNQHSFIRSSKEEK